MSFGVLVWVRHSLSLFQDKSLPSVDVTPALQPPWRYVGSRARAPRAARGVSRANMGGLLYHALRDHLDTRLDALEALLLSDAMRQRRQAELTGRRDYGLPHAATRSPLDPATWTPMREEQEPAVWPPTQPEPHSARTAARERAGGGRRGGGPASSGRHPVRERDVVLLERLGFEAAEAEHALGAAEPDPVDATASRVECAVRWLCQQSQHPRDNALSQGESRTKAGSPAHTAVRGSLEHVERLQRASGLYSGRADASSGQGADPGGGQGAWPCVAVPQQREGQLHAERDGYLSPPPQRHGGAPATPPPPAWTSGWASAPATSTPAVPSPPPPPPPLLGEERERRRLLTVLTHAPSAEILAALQAHLLCPPGPASSAAVSMLSALLPQRTGRSTGALEAGRPGQRVSSRVGVDGTLG